MILSPTQIANLRRQSGSIPRLSILHPATLLSGLVNGSPERGARSISFDGGTGTGFASIEFGMTLFVITVYGQFRARVKEVTGSQSSGTIVMGENAIPWSDNDPITIVHNFELWTIPPTIRGGLEYKDYDVSYTDQGIKPPPVAIVGGHRAGGYVGTKTLRRQIPASLYDGSVRGIGTYSSIGPSINLGLSTDSRNGWFGFTSPIDIPKGSTVTSAILTFVPFSTSSNTVNLKISANDAAGPAMPVDTADYNGRVLTTAQVDWDDATTWTAGTPVNTPSVASIVQELVDSYGIAANDNILFLIKNDSGTQIKTVTAWDSDPTKACILSLVVETVAEFSLDASNSYALALDKTISSVVWSCVHNGGGTSGITIADPTAAQTTLTLEEDDEYWLTCLVTDTNGKGQFARRWINAHGENNPPYSEFTVQQLESSFGTGGWRMTIETYGDVTLADFPDNTIAVLYYDNYFDPGTLNEPGYVNLWGVEDNVLFAGYIRRDTSTDQPGVATGNVVFEITTIESLLANTTDFGTVSINSLGTNRTLTGPLNYGVPSSWHQYAKWLTVGRAIGYYLKWQTSLLDIADVYGLTDNTLGVKNVNFSEPNTLARLNTLAYIRGIFSKVVSDRLGRLHLGVDIQYLADDERDALDTVFTISAEDITDYVSTPRQPEDRVAGVLLDGFAWFLTGSYQPFISIAPAYSGDGSSYGFPSFRGTGTQAIKGQVLNSQDDANKKTGRVLASLNNVYLEIRVTFAGNYVGAFDIPCASVGWYEWGLSDDSLLRNLPLNGARLICRDIQAHADTDGSWTTDVFFEVEAFGAPGIIGNMPTAYPDTPNGGNGNEDDEPPWAPTYKQIFVGATDEGVYLKNWGSDFTTKNNGLSGNELNIRSLRIDPSTGWLWIVHQDGLAYSVDHGNNWIDITPAEMGDPVNTAGDIPAPATTDLDQIDIWFGGGPIYVLRTWASPKRAWVYTSNDTVTWSNTEAYIP